MFAEPFDSMIHSLFLYVAAIYHCIFVNLEKGTNKEGKVGIERSCYPIEHALLIYDRRPRGLWYCLFRIELGVFMQQCQNRINACKDQLLGTYDCSF